MIHSKKGIYFVSILAIAFIFLIIPMLFVRLLGKEEFLAPAFDSLDELRDATHEAEAVLFYIDKSAEYAAQHALFVLGRQGGFINASCGAITVSGKEYNYWNDSCYPNASRSFLHFLNSTLTEYIDAYPGGHIRFPTDYTYSITPSSGKLIITGKTSSGLILNLKGYAEYNVSPSFKFTLDYDLREYGRAIAKTKQLIRDCSPKNDTERELCITDFASASGWTTKKINNATYTFDLTSDKKFYGYETGSELTLSPVIIKFALTFTPH